MKAQNVLAILLLVLPISLFSQSYRISVGSYTNSEFAQELIQGLEARGFDAETEEVSIGGTTYIRVLLAGDHPTEAAAQRTLDFLANNHLLEGLVSSDPWIREPSLATAANIQITEPITEETPETDPVQDPEVSDPVEVELPEDPIEEPFVEPEEEIDPGPFVPEVPQPDLVQEVFLFPEDDIIIPDVPEPEIPRASAKPEYKMLLGVQILLRSLEESLILPTIPDIQQPSSDPQTIDSPQLDENLLEPEPSLPEPPETEIPQDSTEDTEETIIEEEAPEGEETQLEGSEDPAPDASTELLDETVLLEESTDTPEEDSLEGDPIDPEGPEVEEIPDETDLVEPEVEEPEGTEEFPEETGDELSLVNEDEEPATIQPEDQIFTDRILQIMQEAANARLGDAEPPEETEEATQEIPETTEVTSFTEDGTVPEEEVPAQAEDGAAPEEGSAPEDEVSVQAGEELSQLPEEESAEEPMDSVGSENDLNPEERVSQNLELISSADWQAINLDESREEFILFPEDPRIFYYSFIPEDTGSHRIEASAESGGFSSPSPWELFSSDGMILAQGTEEGVSLEEGIPLNAGESYYLVVTHDVLPASAITNLTLAQ